MIASGELRPGDSLNEQASTAGKITSATEADLRDSLREADLNDSNQSACRISNRGRSVDSTSVFSKGVAVGEMLLFG